MIFQHPGWLFVSVGLLICAFVFRYASKQSAWQKVVASGVFSMLSTHSSARAYINTFLMAAAIVAAALSSPSTRNTQSDAYTHTNGWFILADLSRSMTMTDVLPSRLAAMRNTATDLIIASGAKASSLILYSADAFMAVPPSFDKQQLLDTAALLEYGIVKQDGSNLTRALSLTASSIAESGMTQARVFVLSDSGGISNSAIAAANYLSTQGHRVDMLLFGNPAANVGTEQALNTQQAEQLANAGNGSLILSDSLGAIALGKLALNANGHRSQNAAQRALHWKNQSHWILLLLIPLFPSLYREHNLA